MILFIIDKNIYEVYSENRSLIQKFNLVQLPCCWCWFTARSSEVSSVIRHLFCCLTDRYDLSQWVKQKPCSAPLTNYARNYVIDRDLCRQQDLAEINTSSSTKHEAKPERGGGGSLEKVLVEFNEWVWWPGRGVRTVMLLSMRLLSLPTGDGN